MKYLNIKDNKTRQFFLISEQKKRVEKFVSINLLQKIKNTEKKQSIKMAFAIFRSSNKKFYKSNSKTKFNRRCVITNRNRGVYRPFGVSRLLLRDFIHFGILAGFKKAVW